MKKYLEVGKIINKRGLKGELKVECWCDNADVLCSLSVLYFDDSGKHEAKVISAKQYKGFAYILIDGINTPELADKVRGKVLYADRDSIPLEDDGYFIDDLIGLKVYDDVTGKVYGTVTDVFNRGASDIYAISDGVNEYLLPAVDEFVTDIDFEKGISVRPIPGIFDEAEKV